MAINRQHVLKGLGALALLGGAYQLYRMYNGSRLKAILQSDTSSDDVSSSGSQSDNNVKAFLAMIRKCEGTDGANGYSMLFGGSTFSDYSHHPNKNICKSGYCSTAAGAYQILYSTWISVVLPRVSLPDFSPQSQDIAATVLLDYRGVLSDVQNGNFERAINGWSKGTGANKEWASLPNSPYGQPIKTMAFAKGVYQSAGGQVVA